MKIRTNRLMDEKLDEIGYDYTHYSLTLPARLQKLLDDGFRIEQDCVLFKDFLYFGPGDLDTDFSKIQYEEFLNDVCMRDYLEDVLNETDYLKFGLAFSLRLWDRLLAEFRTEFRITVSFYETSYVGNNVDIHGNCTVKFYKVRPASEDKFRIEDLEEYETGIMLVIDGGNF